MHTHTTNPLPPAGVLAASKQYKQAEQLYSQLLRTHIDTHGGENNAGAVAILVKTAAMLAAADKGWEAETTYKRAQAIAIKVGS